MGLVAGASSPPLPRLSPRADVQGLRALAVAMVIFEHAAVPWLRGGFVGVDVFFVVSGFLISALLLHEVTATGRVVSATSTLAGRDGYFQRPPWSWSPPRCSPRWSSRPPKWLRSSRTYV